MDAKTKANPPRTGKPVRTLIQARDLGRIEVSRHVVATIAGHAAAGCYGVVAMAAQGLRDGLAERLHRDNIHRGVDVEVRDDGIAVSLFVIVEFGTRVSEVANNLGDAVRYSVERTLGLAVVEVNVNVQGIHVSGGR
jgi:uncharacterized alkaline shock family protein YloU